MKVNTDKHQEACGLYLRLHAYISQVRGPIIAKYH